jgi:hypothetical protein
MSLRMIVMGGVSALLLSTSQIMGRLKSGEKPAFEALC